MLEAVFGFFGLVAGMLVKNSLGESKFRQEQSRILRTKYLLLLQDAAESLYLRLKNIHEKGGEPLMTDEYFSKTTLYSISKILAVDLMLLRDGMYANLSVDREIITKIKEIISAIHNEFDCDIFFRYYRLEFAEACIGESVLSGWHNFKQVVQKEEYTEAMHAYEKFLPELSEKNTYNLRNLLIKIISLLMDKTKVPSSIDINKEKDKLKKEKIKGSVAG